MTMQPAGAPQRHRTPQKPIGSGFGPATTAAEVIRGHDLRHHIAVVTGGYTGIGLETTRAFVSVGATVIVPARDREKATRALGDIDAAPGAIEIETLDLIDPRSIDACAQRFLASGRPLHLLVNNAGIMATPLTRDRRGFESQFATNHLGHFQLAVRLWPALRAANGARIVALSSRAHQRSAVDFDDPNFDRRPYDRWIAYGQSKTADALFAVGADARGEPAGIRAFSLHPGGIVSTDLVRHMTREELMATGFMDEEGRPIIDPANNKKTPEQGAATTVWCATSPRLNGLGGVYCENCDIALGTAAASTEMLGVRPWATDPEAAERLWLLSERLTSVVENW
jgi:NAD(P)-dependent dehydrogenase (short-subunit alcohol dehydrogenase family)